MNGSFEKIKRIFFGNSLNPSKTNSINNVSMNYNFIEYSKYKFCHDMIQDFVVFDFETTGLDPKVDKIIQIGAIKYRNRIAVESFETYVNPQIPIPTKITQLTGIKNTDVRKAPLIGDALKKFFEIADNNVLVAHNANFDMSFLLANMYNNNFIRRDFKVIDTLWWSRESITDSKGRKLDNYKLETLKRILNIDVKSHLALNDCHVCAQVYLRCIDILKKKNEKIVEEQKIAQKNKLEKKEEKPYKTMAIPSNDVDRNLRGIELEKEGYIENAIELYEINIKNNFEGNHPYDRLAIIYRRRKLINEEIRVLKKAIKVFSNLSRADVAGKLERFKQRLEKIQEQSM